MSEDRIDLRSSAFPEDSILLMESEPPPGLTLAMKLREPFRIDGDTCGVIVLDAAEERRLYEWLRKRQEKKEVT